MEIDDGAAFEVLKEKKTTFFFFFFILLKIDDGVAFEGPIPFSYV